MFKYLCAAWMLLSLVGAFSVAMLGMTYVYEGWGLSPVFAGILSIGLLAMGYLAATILGDDDD